MSSTRLFDIQRDDDLLSVTLLNVVSNLADEQVMLEMEHLLKAGKEPGVKRAVIDFGNVEYFGSNMLGLMMSLWKQLRSQGGAMALCNISEGGREILHMTKFDSIWPIFATKEEAIASLSPTA